MDEVDELRLRIEGLERENERLRAPGTAGGRVRTAVAVVLITVGLLLAPVAALGSWARVQLVDTDRFVATFGPLAEDPEIQAFVAAEVTGAITAQLDVPQLVGEVFDGVRGLDLPPNAAAALGLLEGPAALGVQTLIGDVVDRIIASPTFADVWDGALRMTHAQAIAVIQGDPAGALRLAADGTLSLQLDTIVVRVKEELSARGIGIAELIPHIDREIPIVQAEALVLTRTVYVTAVTVGAWLPWLALLLLVAGIAVARRPVHAAAWTAALFAAVFALLAAAIGIGRTFFTGAMSSSVMPAAAADALFAQLTSALQSTAVALTILGAMIAVGSWLAGTTRPARTVRTTARRGADAVRAAGERRGFTTGRFGEIVDRWRPAIFVVIAVVAALLVFATRPLHPGAVIGIVIGAAVAFVLVELVRRPAPADALG
ncbi:hypothetical protein HD600_000290 [Microbacterium ginsengiterrae]|uniref:Integral membrane protein n=1 Tax=Microbacterium ginsengiterrae TaxID=546115 RepID=A0A7W9FBT9_9MICO|nr:hypothetical protein [Microbacterium ginsengiterrae]MBB5741793.1 hypothetical protein [Microbacterium ginsengiterrae]